MLQFLVASAITITLGTLAGHLLHWRMHRKKWRSHMYHHAVTYPKDDLRSSAEEGYRSSGAFSGWITFAVPVSAVVVALVCSLHAAGVSWLTCAAVASGCAIIGYMHGAIHDAMHVEGHWLGKIVPGFGKLQRLHDQHHRNMKTNFGIVSFLWDRVFGTYRDADK
jgi:sterol desaturase/sphingolipid hydroxylase (fatty acid hydroxylase superfamily)